MFENDQLKFVQIYYETDYARKLSFETFEVRVSKISKTSKTIAFRMQFIKTLLSSKKNIQLFFDNKFELCSKFTKERP